MTLNILLSLYYIFVNFLHAVSAGWICPNLDGLFCPQEDEKLVQRKF
jgi:hypothetical protein